MKFQGIVFDFDGTLIDSLGGAAEVFNEALERLGETPRTLEQIKKYFGTGADRILQAVLQDAERARRAFEVYKEIQKTKALSMPLHGGVPELLETVAEHRIPIAIVTGRHSEDLDIVIERHGIASRFVTIVCDNHLANSKPSPEGILLAAERMKLSPASLMYVGDSVVDIQAAKAAGSAAVAALWDSLIDIPKMREQSPHHYARHPHEIWEIFRGDI
ncbi:MAG: HAD family hydrolase [Bdellovibrionaceae bacterium]|nr:HAD family hydrolase [Pseudobdellovibrionaceae bacterium]MBX3034612.1 HAD family hydrolase [Pseudobdellovibrionaceae bacterium]